MRQKPAEIKQSLTKGQLSVIEKSAKLAMPKKQYTVELAGKYLTEHGLKVNPPLVDGRIEAQIMPLKLQTLQWKAEGGK